MILNALCNMPKQSFMVCFLFGLIALSYAQEDCATVYDVISSEPTFSTAKAAIDRAGLEDFFSDPELSATIFLPNNAGFATFLEEAELTPGELLAYPQLDVFLKGHVIPGAAIRATDFVEGSELQTLNGEDSHVEVSFKKEGDPKYADCAGGVHMHIASHGAVDADPIVCDTMACKAIIHTLDYPLIPHDESFEEYFPKVGFTHEIHEDEDHDHDHDHEEGSNSTTTAAPPSSAGGLGWEGVALVAAMAIGLML